MKGTIVISIISSVAKIYFIASKTLILQVKGMTNLAYRISSLKYTEIYFMSKVYDTADLPNSCTW